MRKNANLKLILLSLGLLVAPAAQSAQGAQKDSRQSRLMLPTDYLLQQRGSMEILLCRIGPKRNISYPLLDKLPAESPLVGELQEFEAAFNEEHAAQGHGPKTKALQDISCIVQEQLSHESQASFVDIWKHVIKTSPANIVLYVKQAPSIFLKVGTLSYLAAFGIPRLSLQGQIALIESYNNLMETRITLHCCEQNPQLIEPAVQLNSLVAINKKQSSGTQQQAQERVRALWLVAYNSTLFKEASQRQPAVSFEGSFSSELETPRAIGQAVEERQREAAIEKTTTETIRKMQKKAGIPKKHRVVPDRLCITL